MRRWNIALVGVGALLIAAWVLGSIIRLPVPAWFFVIGALVVFAINTFVTLWTFRAMRADAARVLSAHSGSVAFPVTIVSWPGAERAERESVIVVAADLRGLSFRDHDDREVLLVPPDRIMSLELAPLEPRARFRPFRVTTIDGAIDFSGPAKPDEQVDAVVALRTALGRQPG